MRKIPTVFQRDPHDRRYVTSEVNPDCAWVLAGEGRATRKFDGTCTMLDDDGRWWARREVKPGKHPPRDFRCEQIDDTTGKAVGWEPIAASSFWKAFQSVSETPTEPGTYELCGPKINGNPEGFARHVLVPHGQHPLPLAPRTFDALAYYLAQAPYEGIVWWHPDGRRAKLKRRDFPVPADPDGGTRDA